MHTYPSHYINGQWVQATSPNTLPVHDASTEEIMATVPEGTAAEAEAAVLAARAAQQAWADLPVETRASYIDKIVEGLKARTDELATAIAREVGMPFKMAKMIQVGGPGVQLGQLCQGRPRVSVGRKGGQFAGAARAHRRGGLHHAVELSAEPNHPQGRPGLGRRLHRGF